MLSCNRKAVSWHRIGKRLRRSQKNRGRRGLFFGVKQQGISTAHFRLFLSPAPKSSEYAKLVTYLALGKAEMIFAF
jgi:hypothetical protein